MTYETQNASLLGNVLMGLGLVVMVVGVGYSILNQLPQLDLPQFFAHGAILSIFVGAVLWRVVYCLPRRLTKFCRHNGGERDNYPYEPLEFDVVQ